jgi:hypothetical protein
VSTSRKSEEPETVSGGDLLARGTDLQCLAYGAPWAVTTPHKCYCTKRADTTPLALLEQLQQLQYHEVRLATDKRLRGPTTLGPE